MCGPPLSAALRPVEGRWQPEETAGPVSRMLFTFVEGLLALGSRKVLVADDLWELVRCDASQ